MSVTKVGACDWCLQEVPLQTIDERLWRFWKVISVEDPTVGSHRNICGNCSSRFREFSTYVDRCRTHASIIDELLSVGDDVEYPPLIKQEERSCSDHPAAGCSSVPEGSDGEAPSPVGSSSDLTCSHCGKTFDRSSKLKAHLYSHKDEKPFKCSHCDKAYVWYSELKVHSRSHAGEYLCKCPFCDKAFARSNNFHSHVRTHTGEKPFECSVCGKTFIQSGNLKTHMRLHTGEEPFRCSLCGKGFTQSSVLKRHMRLHTGEKPFGCSICNKNFTWSSSLKSHMRGHRRDDV